VLDFRVPPLPVLVHTREKVGPEGFAANPVGAGPYRIVKNVQGQEVVFERFEDYWAGSPKGKPAASPKAVEAPKAEVPKAAEAPKAEPPSAAAETPKAESVAEPSEAM